MERDEIRRVEEAVREAERGTAGEIVVVVSRRSASYRSVPLLYGFATALVVPLALGLLTELSGLRVALGGAGAATLALALASPPRVRHRLLPHAIRRARAREGAEREFAARGLAQTRGRTGVLLYVAQAEHYAEVIGDVAITGRVPDDDWRAIVNALVDAFAAGRGADGLVAAVGRIGVVLAQHVPPGSGDVDELPNRVVVI